MAEPNNKPATGAATIPEQHTAEHAPLTSLLRGYAVEMREERSGYDSWEYSVYAPRSDAQATHLASRRKDDRSRHALLLDLDIPAQLISSKTPGHHHLVVDASMTWRQYKRVLRALAKAGVIERSWAKAQIASKAAFIAKPRALAQEASR